MKVALKTMIVGSAIVGMTACSYRTEQQMCTDDKLIDASALVGDFRLPMQDPFTFEIHYGTWVVESTSFGHVSMHAESSQPGNAPAELEGRVCKIGSHTILERNEPGTSLYSQILMSIEGNGTGFTWTGLLFDINSLDKAAVPYEVEQMSAAGIISRLFSIASLESELPFDSPSIGVLVIDNSSIDAEALLDLGVQAPVGFHMNR